MIRQDIIKAINSKLEATILGSSAGTTTQPAGIFYDVTPTVVTNMAGIAEVEGDVEEANVYGDLKWIIDPKFKADLRTMAKGENIAQSLYENGEIDGTTALSTSNVGDKLAKNFSLGMRQRLGIAVALCGNPEFLVLDEPTNGLDPEGIVEMRNLLIKLNKERNITILISSHILDELSKIATHYGFIKDGKMVKEISAEEFEKECKHTIKLEVDSNNLEAVLKKEKYDYNLISDRCVELYGNVEITPLVLKLHKENINVLKLTESDESLENYFFNLLGGDNNE